MILLTARMSFLIPDPGYSQEGNAIQKGNELFKKHCSACHGDAAVGQDPSQPSGGWDENQKRLAPALNGTGHAWHHPPSLLYQYINEGSIDETSPMPAFGNQLSKKDIQAIIAYFQSIWPDEIMNKYNDRFRDKKD